MKPDNRVVITGMGVVTPVGLNVEELFHGLSDGKSGISRITNFEVEGLPVQFGGEIKNELLFERIEDIRLLKKEYIKKNFKDRKLLLTLIAMDELLRSANLDVNSKVLQTADIYYSSGVEQFIFEDASRVIPKDGSSITVDLCDLLKGTYQYFIRTIEEYPAFIIGSVLQNRGVNVTNVSACTASAQAIGLAYQRIQHKMADVIIAGGVDSMTNLYGVTGFAILGALSTNNENPSTACRPFDRTRDGAVLGEGAALFVLESLEHAKKRNATIYAEIIGHCNTCDAYSITHPDPDGLAITRALRGVMDNARISADDIDYINAHGTSTPINDYVETKSIKKAFGEHAYKLKISSTKSMMGHLIAAAGACELVATVLSIQRGILFPTINLNEPDPECDLNYVPNRAIRKDINVGLSNSFGFGGFNTVLAVKRYTDDG